MVTFCSRPVPLSRAFTLRMPSASSPPSMPVALADAVTFEPADAPPKIAVPVPDTSTRELAAMSIPPSFFSRSAPLPPLRPTAAAPAAQ